MSLQVFCSALPVSYDKLSTSSDWEPLARLVLEGLYEATLAVAALLAADRNRQSAQGTEESGEGVNRFESGNVEDNMEEGNKDGPEEAKGTEVEDIGNCRKETRLTVYLTCVGGGAFGNRRQWIADAISRALALYSDEPLDVKLVHYMTVPQKGSRNPFRLVEEQWKKQKKKVGKKTKLPEKQPGV